MFIITIMTMQLAFHVLIVNTVALFFVHGTTGIEVVTVLAAYNVIFVIIESSKLTDSRCSNQIIVQLSFYSFEPEVYQTNVGSNSHSPTGM